MSMTEIGQVFIDHIVRLANCDNSEYRAILQARTLGKYYARHHIKQPIEFKTGLMKCEKMDIFQNLVLKHFC